MFLVHDPNMTWEPNVEMAYYLTCDLLLIMVYYLRACNHLRCIHFFRLGDSSIYHK